MQIEVSGRRPFARPYGAIAIHAREDILDCPKCGLRWTPVRVHRRVDPRPLLAAQGAKVRTEPLPLVRCVGCKATVERPIAPIPSLSESQNAA